jgi:hypothetical protein
MAYRRRTASFWGVVAGSGPRMGSMKFSIIQVVDVKMAESIPLSKEAYNLWSSLSTSTALAW